MADPNQGGVARIFVNAFAESLAQSYTQKLGAAWQVKPHDDENVPAPAGSAIHVRLSAAGGLQGECFVAFEQAQVIAIGSKLLEQPDSDLIDPQADALAELLGSAMDAVSAALAATFGVVTFKVDRVEDVRLDELLAVALDVSSDAKAEEPIMLYFDQQLLGSLSSTKDEEQPMRSRKATGDASNLQLVMDVELNVSLRFGQCQLPLRDVLDLTSGSVIELDRDVDDPVELLLDGKVIARGEAVIVDGNYGLRVTEIPEPIASHFIS